MTRWLRAYCGILPAVLTNLWVTTKWEFEIARELARHPSGPMPQGGCVFDGKLLGKAKRPDLILEE